MCLKRSRPAKRIRQVVWDCHRSLRRNQLLSLRNKRARRDKRTANFTERTIIFKGQGPQVFHLSSRIYFTELFIGDKSVSYI